jgi:hypothetical protein
MVYKWFDHLKTEGYYSTVYVIMPNHLHVILYFPEAGFNLNKIISNAKRFMAYEIVKRLEEMKRQFRGKPPQYQETPCQLFS